MRDGLATSALASEVRTWDRLFDSRDVWALPWAGSNLLAYDMHDVTLVTDGWNYPTIGLQYTPISEDPSWTPNSTGPLFDTIPQCPEIEMAAFDWHALRKVHELLDRGSSQ